MSEQKDRSGYLKINGLTKKFGNFVALNEVSLEVNQGEFVCFLGPSGCGKTTLLRAIAGLDIQTHGEIFQDGRDVSALPPIERDFGIVFQSYALFPNLSVAANIAYGLENEGQPKANIETRVKELLELVGLPDQTDKYPAQLSGGQQQRVALARAIAISPGLLLLDEPLSALDAKVRVNLRREIKSLQEQLGVTTVMVTHDQEEALTMADRIVVMNQGRIEQVGTPEEIYGLPATRFVADFIGAMNFIPATCQGNKGVRIGERIFNCKAPSSLEEQPVVASIRPEDILVTESSSNIGENVFQGKVEDLEFLGAFARATISSDELGEATFVADVSANLMREQGLSEGRAVSICFPAKRIRIYAGEL